MEWEIQCGRKGRKEEKGTDLFINKINPTPFPLLDRYPGELQHLASHTDFPTDITGCPL